jgi:hypothetical protein
VNKEKNMSKSSEAVKKWRRKVKKALNSAFGSKCGICGYSRYYGALELHHLEPKDKKIAFGQHTANPAAWDKLVLEAKKCVLLCSTCHRELEAGVTELPIDIQRFDGSLVTYAPPKTEYNDCPVCGEKKNKLRKTCSRACAAKKATKSGISLEDLVLIWERESNNFESTGRVVGVSGSAVRRRLVRSKIIPA